MTEPEGFKGTKGEWRAAEVDEHSVIEIQSSAVQSRVPLATIELGFLDEFDDEQWGNATLFAASKDLLAALQGALKALTAETIGTTRMDDPDWYREVDVAVTNARAAISKALQQEGSDG